MDLLTLISRVLPSVPVVNRLRVDEPVLPTPPIAAPDARARHIVDRFKKSRGIPTSATYKPTDTEPG